MTLSHQLSLAKAAYESGNPAQALVYTTQLISLHFKPEAISSSPRELLLEYLDALTLHQTLLILNNRPVDYISFEPYIKELTSILFNSDFPFYYALHSFDACEAMAMHNYIMESKNYLNTALSLIHTAFGECPYLSFMEHICNAQIAFYMEDYYACIDSAVMANELWYTSENEPLRMPYRSDDAMAIRNIERIGINNLLLLCNAYGKINNPKDSINLLEELLSQNAFDCYQTISAEITLAELYLINGQKNAALPLYEKYKYSNFSVYPGLSAALSSMAYIVENDISDFTLLLNSRQYCYSHNMFTISRYNYGLALVSQGKYSDALAHFISAKEIGYSMRVSILAHLNRISELEELRDEVYSYFYRQINQIIAHYDEILAYNHLAKLQYHIDYVLGAYCKQAAYPSAAYDFLLNTKYISLETSYLKKGTGERQLYTSSQVMKQLSSDTVLLEFTCLRMLDAVYYGVFVVSQSSISYITLGQKSCIDELINKWIIVLQESVNVIGKDAELLTAKQQDIDTGLRKMLYLPLKALIWPTSKLLIAPAGAMVNFPFSRLSISAGRTLGDNHSIYYINTGKELINSLPNCITLSICQDSALVVGNPNVSQFADLPYSEVEADMAAYFLNTSAYKKEHATIANISIALDSMPNILHFAAHGIFASPSSKNEDIDWDALYEIMSNSGIVLADDVLLSCDRIARLDLSNTKLAVLSCCHSGEAVYLGTEGAYGLRRSLTLSGCKSLIISLWQVDDAASFLWMKAFYETLTITGSSIEEAYSAATDTLKNYESEGTYPYANPYYWAGFVLISPH